MLMLRNIDVQMGGTEDVSMTIVTCTYMKLQRRYRFICADDSLTFVTYIYICIYIYV